MYSPVQQLGGGFAPSHPGQLPTPQFYRPFADVEQAICALPPSLFQVANEMRIIYGTAPTVVLGNLLAAAGVVAAGSFRICDHRGNSMNLSLQVDVISLPLSGKSDAFKRLTRPIRECMRGWPHRWLFADITQSALHRCILQGTVYGFHAMDEGMGFFRSKLSSSFDLWNNLYEGEVPPFLRSEDARDTDPMTPESIVFSTCINTQPTFYASWLKKHKEEALGSGSLYRKLIFQSDEKAERGTHLQPERALYENDLRVTEIVAQALQRLKKMAPHQLPALAVSSEAEQVLSQAIEKYFRFSQAHLSPRDAEVFAVRLATNVRRIAGIMHVFENYAGSVSAETMARAVTVGEFAAVCWLDVVFPITPPPQDILDSYRLEQFLNFNQGRMSETDLRDSAANFYWTEGRMKDAITALCGSGRALQIPRIERKRRRVMIELQGAYPLPFGNI